MGNQPFPQPTGDPWNPSQMQPDPLPAAPLRQVQLESPVAFQTRLVQLWVTWLWVAHLTVIGQSSCGQPTQAAPG